MLAFPFLTLLLLLPTGLATGRPIDRLVTYSSSNKQQQPGGRKLFAKFTSTTNWRDVIGQSGVEELATGGRAAPKKVRLLEKEGDFDAVAKLALGQAAVLSENVDPRGSSGKKESSSSSPKKGKNEVERPSLVLDPAQWILGKQQEGKKKSSGTETRVPVEQDPEVIKRMRDRGMAEGGFFNGGVSKRRGRGGRRKVTARRAEDEVDLD